MSKNYKKITFVFMMNMMIMCLLFCGCGKKKDTKIHLKFTVFDSDGKMNEMVNSYNESHDDVVIELEVAERSEDIVTCDFEGIDQMKREIVSGKGPDIIDFGSLYSTSDIMGDYTIDLSGYIKNCPIPVTDNLINAFSVDGTIRCIPTDVLILSLEVPYSNGGYKTGWNLQELMDDYEQFHTSDSKLLFYGQNKLDVFSMFLSLNMNEYIDWNHKECHFDEEEFKTFLNFCNSFPDQFDYDKNESFLDCYRNHDAFLLLGGMSSVYDVCISQYLFGEDFSYVGYPVRTGVGNVVESGDHMLAISSSCKYPDIAWDFLQTFWEEEYQSEVLNLPINREIFEKQLEEASALEKNESTKEAIPKYVTYVGDSPEAVEIYQMESKDIQKVTQLVDSANLSTGIDWRIYNTIYEEADSFFAGAKSLNEVCDIIQSRVSMYVYEQE